MTSFLLDTHTWLWWFSEPARLSRQAYSLIESPSEYDRLIICTISFWEIRMLAAKERITLGCEPEEWIELAHDLPKLEIAPISPQVAKVSTNLPPPFQKDPADQIIVATARVLGATLITKDKSIRRYPHVSTVW